MGRDSSKKTIALIVENIFTDFAGGLIQSLSNAIHLYKNINLVVIAGQYDLTRTLVPQYQDYLGSYNAIYQLQQQCKFDGMIVCLGSMVPANVELFDRWVKRNQNMPTVYTVCEIEDRVSVNYDNTTGIREAVDYLVNFNGFRHFAMMGGREDNFDSMKRKEIYSQSLAEYGITFEEKNYIATEMFVDTQEEARILLDRNPDVQAIFCVNDSVAVGLYQEMARRRLVPGKDIMVFGFDNTKTATRMIPPLASVGAGNETMGKKALELLLKMIDGEQVESATVGTRFYGRESLPYSMYEFSNIDWRNIEEETIYNMFDECFYRYKPEFVSREAIDLRRLLKEIVTHIISALRNQYMSSDSFNEAKDLIRIFFDNGAMRYTDTEKFLSSIDHLYASVNATQNRSSSGHIEYVNRLFSYARDCVIQSLSKTIRNKNDEQTRFRRNLLDFLVDIEDAEGEQDNLVNRIVANFEKLNMRDAALFCFEQPVIYEKGVEDFFPEMIRLCCLTKGGQLHVISEERRAGRLSELYQRVELADIYKECATFPIFYKTHYYGFLVCKIDSMIPTSGECIAQQIGRSIYLLGEKLI